MVALGVVAGKERHEELKLYFYQSAGGLKKQKNAVALALRGFSAPTFWSLNLVAKPGSQTEYCSKRIVDSSSSFYPCSAILHPSRPRIHPACVTFTVRFSCPVRHSAGSTSAASAASPASAAACAAFAAACPASASATSATATAASVCSSCCLLVLMLVLLVLLCFCFCAPSAVHGSGLASGCRSLPEWC